jgi:hypothetical protein
MKFPRPALATAMFLPAMLGLAVQVENAPSLPQSLLGLALLLLAPEQGHMAGVDLRQIAAVERRRRDPRLHAFRRLVWVTILGQLAGFYLAAVGWLGQGMLVILGSLVTFNLMAAIRLEPDAENPVQVFGAANRRDVLILNSVAASLGLLWLLGLAQLWAAIGMLAIVLAYVGSKLAGYGKAWQLPRPTSVPHVSDSVE